MDIRVICLMTIAIACKGCAIALDTWLILVSTGVEATPSKATMISLAALHLVLHAAVVFAALSAVLHYKSTNLKKDCYEKGELVCC